MASPISNLDQKRLLWPLDKNEKLTDKETEAFKKICPTLAQIGIWLKHDLCEEESDSAILPQPDGKYALMGNAALLRIFENGAKAILEPERTAQNQRAQRIEKLQSILLRPTDPTSRFLDLTELSNDTLPPSAFQEEKEEEKGNCSIS